MLLKNQKPTRHLFLSFEGFETPIARRWLKDLPVAHASAGRKKPPIVKELSRRPGRLLSRTFYIDKLR